jgi:hypothetical protein
MMDEFTKAALDVVRLLEEATDTDPLSPDADPTFLRKNGGAIQKALDALVAAAPDPKERLIEAALLFVDGYGDIFPNGISSLIDAADAYRRSLEGE